MRLTGRGMSVNGVCLDTAVSGYTTIGVEGREQMPIDIEAISLAGVDGARYISRRFESKKLTVYYALVGTGLADMQTKYNALKKALQVEEASIEFDDEPNLYWTGTPELQAPKYRGMDAATGKIIIYLSYPYKQGTTNTVSVAEDAATFNYNGNYPAYPVFTITCNSNIGFVGIADDNDHVIQIGNPLEPDQEVELEDTESIVTIDGKPPTSWTQNDANFTLLNTRTKDGSVSTVSGASVPTFGTETGWHGPTLSYALPYTAGSIDYPVNATFQWRHRMVDNTKKFQQLGMFQAEMRDADGGSIAGVIIYHSSKGNKNSYIDLYVAGARVKQITFKMTSDNKYTGSKGGFGSMEKFGDTITFKIGTGIYSFSNTTLAEKKVAKCGIFFGKNGSNTVLNQNKVTQATIISHQVESHEAIPNKFQSGDVITVDCAEGSIYVNGVREEGLGALGNDYESFVIVPGSNTIGFVASDWATTAPTYSISYKGVYA